MLSDGGPEHLCGRVLVGRYRVGEPIGRGGVGVVYRAEHLALGRTIAIKVLHSEALAMPSALARFEREARALGTLSHPHIVTITDFGRDGTTPFLAMEMVEGRSLREVLDEGSLPFERAMAIIRQIFRALAYAHAEGVLHRDLKPGNIMLRQLPDGEHVKILDFGMAKLTGSRGDGLSTSLTASGFVVGTPAYLAPELLDATRAAPQSDLYAVGVMLFEMLAGGKPFDGETPLEIIHGHLAAPVPSLADRGCVAPWSAALDALLARMMAKEPANRPNDAGEALRLLEQAGGVGTSDGGVAAYEDTMLATAATERPPPPAAPVVPASARRRGAGARWLTAVFALSAAALAWWQPSLSIVSAPDEPRAPPALDEAGVAQVDEEPAEAARITRPRGPVMPGVPAASPHPPDEAPPLRDEAPPEVAPVGAPLALEAPPDGAPAGADEPVSAVNGPVDLLAAPLPRRLARLRRLARRARRPAQFSPLYDYARDHPQDARVHLILAHAFVRLGWRADALTRYRQAVTVDSQARGDAQMLRDLLALARGGRLARSAADAIVEIYGDEARPAVMAAADEAADDDARTRLRRLARRLG